ncbi:toxic anion resistance protein [Lactococcus termiticola]|uniref:Tellurite resistance protein TelA n=1 Tax=Lactococcus termiticola TaxID=2169526 RepID=A0A2R5HD17_9LACT|nr:toxic anion resistance protein [Lactococcus termiticola]GBG95979.1 tellurite resistance protein TelA [Lactococcus termiticola]
MENPVVETIKLEPEEEQKVKDLALALNPKQSETISNFGLEAQKSMTEFSTKVLNSVKTKDLGEVGTSLNDLMFQLKNADPSDLTQEDNLFEKIFKRAKKSIFDITAKYQKIDAGVELVSERLDEQANQLIADNKTLDGLYEENLNYFKELNLYISAADQKLKELESETIPALQKRAEEENNPMLTQELSDLKAFQNRLDKRKYDLTLARQISIQQAPQIRLIQSTNAELSDKIQASINTAIPLWKNQLTVALTLLNQKQALSTQKAVSDTTNNLLMKNAEALKTSSIATAQEQERGIVDIETLKATQARLIETIDETLKIQAEGSEKRRQSEAELAGLEAEMKAKLLNLTQGHKEEA